MFACMLIEWWPIETLNVVWKTFLCMKAGSKALTSWTSFPTLTILPQNSQIWNLSHSQRASTHEFVVWTKLNSLIIILTFKLILILALQYCRAGKSCDLNFLEFSLIIIYSLKKIQSWKFVILQVWWRGWSYTWQGLKCVAISLSTRHLMNWAYENHLNSKILLLQTFALQINTG